MKYTVEGFQQAALVELGIDSVDAVILRWFVDFTGTGRMTKLIHEDREYCWVFFQRVIEDLPILRIENREAISRRFGKMVECGLLEKCVIKNKAGTFTGYRLNPDRYSILVQGDATRLKGVPPDSKVDPPPDSKVDPKDSSIIRDKKKKKEPPAAGWGDLYGNPLEEVEAAYFSAFKALHAQGRLAIPEPVYDFPKSRARIKARLRSPGKDAIIKAIEAAKVDDFVVDGGFSITTILSDSVMTRLLGARPALRTGGRRQVPASPQKDPGIVDDEVTRALKARKEVRNE